MQRIFDEPTRILVADDVVFNRMGLKLMFESVKYNLIIDEAVNGFEAVELFKTNLKETDGLKYKYLFIDITMPVKDGF